MDDEELAPGTPWRRDLDEVGPELERWARKNVDPNARVSEVQAPGNGMSSETVLFTMTHDGAVERYCARLAPMPDVYPVFPEYDIALQHRCMDLVRSRTDVPAPEVRWIEYDAQWLGTPFLVMVRIDGAAPPDIPPYVFGGWLADASPEQRQALQRRSVEILAKLHRITPANTDLSFLARPQHGSSALDQQLGHERWYYEWAREGVSYPLIERTFRWLDDHRSDKTETETVLNWGDARIGNVLYRDFEPVAVLDWEMATVGPCEVDPEWMYFLPTFFEDLAERFGVPSATPDFMQRDALVATYEELTGHTVIDLEWYEVFAALRFAIVSVRTSTRGIAYGQMEKPDDPDDLIMFRTLLERMLA
jgi:aminoglycoside phosphotransferase (APT) family kinase protein